MKNMETLTNMKNTAEQGKREADKEILRLESEVHKLKTMRQPPQSVAATKVHETLLPRANHRESGSVYTKQKQVHSQKQIQRQTGNWPV